MQNLNIITFSLSEANLWYIFKKVFLNMNKVSKNPLFKVALQFQTYLWKILRKKTKLFFCFYFNLPIPMVSLSTLPGQNNWRLASNTKKNKINQNIVLSFLNNLKTMSRVQCQWEWLNYLIQSMFISRCSLVAFVLQ